MGITIFSLRSMLLPVQNLVAWFAGTPARGHGAPSLRSIASEVRRNRFIAASPACRHHARPSRALRVVRVVDGNHTARGAGRMVISGRMADVCAELERLAALEAAAG
jgi:hypothetical protein